MKIKKLKETFADYEIEVSYGQLMAIKNALASCHEDAVSDEIFAEISWYLDNVPGPGESEDEFDAKKEGGIGGPAPAPGEGDADALLPAPGAGGATETPDDSEELPPAEGDEMPVSHHSRFQNDKPEGGEESEVDRHLPAPDEE